MIVINKKAIESNSFRLLTLGWSDGNTFLPLAFTLLSSAKEKNRLCPENKTLDKRTNGSKLRKEALLKSPDAMLKLIKRAVELVFQLLMFSLTVGLLILRL
ncbi:MAG: hypothetical protein ABF633_01325 [Clostridium sp.]|uniref:hypothetical protein n=1 Tax=Clostridium sp. TaxID=1506 RepID=UPI0039EBD218